ncbi:hypothetical protein GCM10009641_31450 [Mycobacterium cookii]|uniref:Uncharacterized protein n=1 Tax=Nocardioides furvisabuli TaxID=375542 RepID=A0ABN2XPI5_9ACTN
MLTDDVERHHTGGRGEDDEDDTQGQHLLAEGDETCLKRAHGNLYSCVGEGHTRQKFTPVTPVTEEFLSNYNGVISTRHAVTCV